MKISFFFMAGWLLVIVGLSMVYKPLGIIVGGLLLIAMALVEDKRDDKRAGKVH